MTLMPFAIFGVAWLKVSFSVPLLAPFNVLSLRNHNAGGPKGTRPFSLASLGVGKFFSEKNFLKLRFLLDFSAT
jgi:hypothetical protein